jgi:hypothetical protein
MSMAESKESDVKEFERVLRGLIAGEVPIDHAFNEFVGHADVLRQLLEVSPPVIRADLEFLHRLYQDCVDETGAGVIGIFPRLQDPHLAVAEGRIADYVAEHIGIRYGDGYYNGGRVVRQLSYPGWIGVGSPLTNNRFPYAIDTSASNYFSTRFWRGGGAPPGFIAIPEGGRAVFRGEFPYARYWALHPCDIDTNTFPTLLDEDLEPDADSANPFRGPVPETMGRRYSASITFEPDPGPGKRDPNTCYGATTRQGKPNAGIFVIYRTTGSELGGLPPNNAGVLLPSITVFDGDGNEVDQYPEVEPYELGIAPPVETTHFGSFPVPDHRALIWPGKWGTKSNWGLEYDLLASDDILYLVAPYSDRLGEVFVTRQKAFTYPRTPEEPVYTKGKDIRGFTVTNYNIWAGICNSALIDYQIPVDEEGYITLVVSTRENRPKNATSDVVGWIDWGEYMDGQLTYRLLVRRNEKLQALKRAIDSGEASPEIEPYVPRSVHCSKATYEHGGWEAAFAAADEP